MTAPIQQIYLGEAASGGATTWDPSQLGSALRAWYKTDTLGGSNGDPQTSITDYSGNGFTLSQVTTGRVPTLALANQNSLNTLRFTASSLQFYPLDDAIAGSLTSASLYIMWKAVSGSQNRLYDPGSSALGSHYPYLDNVFYNDFGSTTRKTVGTASNAVAIYKSLSIYSAVNDWALFIDGGTGGSSGGTSPLFSTASNTVGWGTGTKIGTDGTSYFDGFLGEFILTNAKQSTSDRQKVEGYLAWKWGIVANLDTAHPYKLVAP